MSNIVSKICSLPKNFYEEQNKSPIQLFKESGYRENPYDITKQKLVKHLEENPSLIFEWEKYSSDIRYSPSWYFLKDNSNWVVGYSDESTKEQRIAYSSEFEACAEFILREIEQFMTIL